MSDGFGFFYALVGVIFVFIIGLFIYGASHTGTATFTVESKERGGDEKPALVFTENETYEVGDSMLDGHFSSSDTYGRLKEGKTYECAYRGVRIPLFSMYKNLTDCTEVGAA